MYSKAPGMLETVDPLQPTAVDVSSPARIELARGQRLQVCRGEREDVVVLLNREGETAFTLRLTEHGPVLSFEHGLTIETRGTLGLEARQVDIRGSEGVSIRSGGDAAIDVAGELTTAAHTQHVCARVGNVNVKANDDVRLNGERIKLNS
jgi:uncharacterized protein (DUF2345 family)